MKKLLAGVLFLVTAFGLFAQGQLYVDNTANNNPSLSATANGLFFVDTAGGASMPFPIDRDFNLNFYGGSDSANLVLLKSFVGPNATGDNAGPGFFSDPSGLAVTIPGATTTGFFRIEAWLASSGPTWATAAFRNSITSANTIFSNPVTTPPNLPPTLTGMPAILIYCTCPEPSAFALGILGAAFFFFWRRTTPSRAATMKKFLLSAVVLSSAFGAFGQGQIYVDNTANNNPSPFATANGLFFLDTGGGCLPINLDFNLAFYGGSDSANLVLYKLFVGASAAGDNAGPGWFSDPSGLAVTVPGATTSAFFRIEAWLGGPGQTWATATTKNSPSSAFTIFSNPVTTPPNLPPTLTGMPAIVLGSPETVCPEPTMLALVSLGATFLFFWRRK